MAEALVGRALGGDVDAFMWLTEPIEAQLYSLALRITHSVPRATELSVAAIAEVYLQLGDYRPKKDLRTWILHRGVAELLHLVRRGHQPEREPETRLPALALVGV